MVVAVETTSVAGACHNVSVLPKPSHCTPIAHNYKKELHYIYIDYNENAAYCQMSGPSVMSGKCFHILVLHHALNNA